MKDIGGSDKASIDGDHVVVYIKGAHYWLDAAMFWILLLFQTTTIDGQCFVYAIASFAMSYVYVSSLPWSLIW